MECNIQHKYTKIADYMAGDMTETERAEFEAHLLECDECFAQAQLFEKAVQLIRSEGDGAFVPQTSPNRLTDRVVKFVTKRRIFRLPKYAFAPLVLLLVLAVSFSFSYKRYNSAMQATFEFKSFEGFFRGLRTAETFETLDIQQFSFLFSTAQTRYVNGEYKNAISLFSRLQSQIDSLDISKEENIEWQYKIQLYLGASKIRLWQQQQPGYFEWLVSRFRSRETDTSLLSEARQNLSQAQKLGALAPHDIQKEQNLQALLSTIAKRIHSQ